MKIRRARPGDAEGLSRVAFRAKASWGYPRAWLSAWDAALTVDGRYVREHGVFVADAGGAVAGFVAVEAGPPPEISHLWVDPEWQGMGVGRALVDRAVRFGRRRGWRAFRIEADPNAVPFYEKLGAARIGEVDAPVLGTPRTLPVLELPLGPPRHRGRAPAGEAR